VAVEDKLLKALNEIFGDSVKTSDRWNIYSLLRDLAEEVAMERASMDEAQAYIHKIAVTIASLLASEGKGGNVEEIEKKISDAFTAEVATRTLATLQKMMAQRRIGRKKSGLEGLI